MHLNLPTSTLTVGEGMEAMGFGIGNLAVIMELLRSKMYSYPIRTIIQEIASNARDANREVGKPDEPIYIKLPTREEPELHITDSGPGIDPDRMKNVYSQYGSSTKRESDLETVRFGLGAKCPFAYTSTYGIETVSKENGKNIFRQYVATIDPSRKGKIYPVSKEGTETDKPCGTTIKVPVKPQDVAEFIRWTTIMLGRWNPLPKINLSAETIFPIPMKPDVQGEDWELIMHKDTEKGVFYYEDSIPYKVEAKNFEEIPEKLKTLFDHVRVNIFGKGKVEITGNRESLDYLPHVQVYLLEKLQTIYNEMNKRLSDMVANCPNMWEALCIATRYKEEFHTNLLRDVMWKDKKLPVFDSVSLDYARVYEIERDSSNAYGVKIEKKRWGFTPRKSVLLLENPSSGRPNAAYLQQAYEYAEKHFDELKIQNWSFYVVSWYNDVQTSYMVTREKEKYCWNDWGIQSLKDFKPPHLAADGTRKYRVVKVRKFVQNQDSYRDRWPEADVDIDADGGVYVILHEREPVGCSAWDIHHFVSHTGETVYGIPRRFAFKGEEIRLGSNWIPFKQAVVQAYEDAVAEKGNVIIPEQAIQYLPHNMLYGELRDHLQKLVETKQVNGKIAKWFNYSKTVCGRNDNVVALANLAGRSNELVMDSTAIELAKDVWKSFPLLFTFDGVPYGLGDKLKAQLKQIFPSYVNYVQMIEQNERSILEKAWTEANAEDAERSCPAAKSEMA